MGEKLKVLDVEVKQGRYSKYCNVTVERFGKKYWIKFWKEADPNKFLPGSLIECDVIKKDYTKKDGSPGISFEGYLCTNTPQPQHSTPAVVQPDPDPEPPFEQKTFVHQLDAGAVNIAYKTAIAARSAGQYVEPQYLGFLENQYRYALMGEKFDKLNVGIANVITVLTETMQDVNATMIKVLQTLDKLGMQIAQLNKKK